MKTNHRRNYVDPGARKGKIFQTYTSWVRKEGCGTMASTGHGLSAENQRRMVAGAKKFVRTRTRQFLRRQEHELLGALEDQ